MDNEVFLGLGHVQATHSSVPGCHLTWPSGGIPVRGIVGIQILQ